jgi:hypothetical protein
MQWQKGAAAREALNYCGHLIKIKMLKDDGSSTAKSSSCLALGRFCFLLLVVSGKK